MKWALVLIAFSSGFFSFGQTYFPFISASDSSDQWRDFQVCSYQGGNQCLEYFLTDYSINGDTIINSIQYSKLFAVEQNWFTPGVGGGTNCPTGTGYTSFYAGGIREAGKQVFFQDTLGTSEYLMYDFNLTVGDTAPDPLGWINTPEFRVISSIDSVLVGNSYRKRFFLQEINGVTTEIIEGIGASTGLLHHITINISCNFQLCCYKENETTMFLHPECFYCDFNLNLKEMETHFELSPNPASDYLTIQSDLGSDLDVELINSFGEVVRSKKLESYSNTLNISDLSSGIYVVKISVDGKVGVQKLVIE